MSILIKGAEKPDHCLLCFAFRNGICAVAKKEVVLSKGVQEWCPLIEIPPHGDLIDRDKLMKSLEHEWDICMDDTEFANKIVPNGIKDAATVIESEE